MVLLNMWRDYMSRKRENKMDLLDLPVAERKRLCFEIRAALQERVASGKIPVSDDVIIANKSVRGSVSAKPFDDLEVNNLRRAAVKLASALKKP